MVQTIRANAPVIPSNHNRAVRAADRGAAGTAVPRFAAMASGRTSIMLLRPQVLVERRAARE